MADLPDGRRLLDQARSSLLAEILPALPADKRYTALMIANAIAIAAREFSEDARTRAEEAAALAAYLGVEGEGLTGMKERLAREIRAGERDGQGLLQRLLLDSAVRRLRINNPKAVGTRNGE